MAQSIDEEPIQTFDYVTVGGGPSAMGLLRGLLETLEEGLHPSISIAVVEMGNETPDPATLQLENWYPIAHDKSLAKGTSVRHINADITGRKMDLPIGQGLGGTTNINAGLVAQPLTQDFETWPAPWNKSLLPCTKKILDKLHKQAVVRKRTLCSWIRHLSEFPGAEWDTNVCTLEQTTINKSPDPHFVRRNYYNSLVAPFLDQNPHLQQHIYWSLQTQAQRLLIDNENRIYGIECLRVNQQNMNYTRNPWEIHARHAVILCTGAIESPVLLRISRMGASNSEAIDEDTYKGVGRHLQDQVSLPRTYLTLWRRQGKPSYSSNGIAALGFWNGPCGDKTLYQVAVADANSHGTILPAVLATVFRWNNKNRFWGDIGEWTFQVTKGALRMAIRWTPIGTILDHCSTTMLMFFIRPYSEGSVYIKHRSETSAKLDSAFVRRQDVSVEADVGYLNDPRDVDMLREAWNASFGHVKKNASKTGPTFLIEIFSECIFMPLSRLLGVSDWFPWFCNVFCQPYFHFSGTCAMQIPGGRDDWVVDSNLRVRGCHGLYICDASVFPNPISSPPALTCCAMGYEFSNMLLKEYKKTKLQ